MDARLSKFAGAYQSTLSQLNVQVAYADLRYPNGFAVRKPAGLKAISAKQIPAKELPIKPAPIKPVPAAIKAKPVTMAPATSARV